MVMPNLAPLLVICANAVLTCTNCCWPIAAMVPEDCAINPAACALVNPNLFKLAIVLTVVSPIPLSPIPACKPKSASVLPTLYALLAITVNPVSAAPAATLLSPISLSAVKFAAAPAPSMPRPRIDLPRFASSLIPCNSLMFSSCRSSWSSWFASCFLLLFTSS